MPQSSGNETVDDASIFRLLSNQRRLHVLDALDAAGGEMEFDELVVEVASRESDRQVTPDERISHVETSLFHNHLPQLDDAGVVEFDVENRGITLSEVRRVEDLLEVVFGD